jgi:E3 ubiquitin-protein ligase RNF144
MDNFIRMIYDLKTHRNPSHLDIPQKHVFWLGFAVGSGQKLTQELIQAFCQVSNLEESQIFQHSTLSYLIYQICNDFEGFKSSLEVLSNYMSEELYYQSLNPTQLEECTKLYNFLCEDREPEIIANNFNPEPIYEPIYEPNYEPLPKIISQCKICLEEAPADSELSLQTCDCFFHSVCLSRYLQNDIEMRKFPISCPNCKVEMHENDIVIRLDEEWQTKFHAFSFKKFVDGNPEYSCCPTPDCDNVFIAEDNNYYQCQICRKEYCLRCKVEFHNNRTCEQYQQELRDRGSRQVDQQFFEFVKGTHYKMCPNCRFWVEKSSGCDHMTCRCGYQFCYRCGGKYGGCRCG